MTALTTPIGRETGRSAPRVLLVANTAWYLYNFRRGLAHGLRERGAEVTLVAPHDKYADLLVGEGLRWIDWPVNRRGINPLRELASVRSLRQIYRREDPDLVHHFTIKCNIYGTMATRGLSSCRVVNTVTGLGHAFLSDSARCRAVRPLIQRAYRWALTRPNVSPMFQNEDDARLLLGPRRFERLAPAMTTGSGVDLAQFRPTAEPAEQSTERPLRVLFAGRLVREKGIVEFVDAAASLKEDGFNAEFIACGGRDGGNRSVVDDATYDRWASDGRVRFLGHQDDIAAVLRDVDLVVLPSYREGTPRVLMEAAAMGLPIVATDVPGCRNVAIHGENALLVPAQDAGMLAAAIGKLLSDDQLRQELAEGSLRLSRNYDVRRINEQIYHAYRQAGVTHLRYEQPSAPAQPVDQPDDAELAAV